MRKPRLKIDGEGFYHVTSRCVDRTFRFKDTPVHFPVFVRKNTQAGDLVREQIPVLLRVLGRDAQENEQTGAGTGGEELSLGGHAAFRDPLQHG